MTYHSSPRHPPKYVLYLTRRGDDASACMVVAFSAPGEARRFLDALLADDGFVWDDACTIRSETGIVVSTRWFADTMRACVEHVVTDRDPPLDDRYVGYARLFRHGPDVRPTSDGGVEPVVRAPRPAPQPRESRDGLVTVAEIAATLGVEPREARQALRSLKIEKPAAGWAWPPAQVVEVTERLRRELGRA